MRRPPSGGSALAVLLVASLGLGTACALRGPLDLSPSPSLHLLEVAGEGDGRRRASTDLALQALDAELHDDTARARGLYARSLQTDASNPYAYLALARYHVDQGEATQALEHLARAEDLLRSYELDSPRVEVHLTGLRGVALRLQGRGPEAEALLEHAARGAPSVWGDGRLTAAELR